MNINKVIVKKIICVAIIPLIVIGIGFKIYFNHKASEKVLSENIAPKGKSEDRSISNDGGMNYNFEYFNKDKSKQQNKDNKNISDKTIHIDMKSHSIKINEPSEPKRPSEPINRKEDMNKSTPNNYKNLNNYGNSKSYNKKGNYKEFFKDDLFMGDSITDSLVCYGFLNKKNVCAKIGININNVKNKINSIQISNPRKIYLLYGINDIDNTTSSEWFISQYKDIIHTVKEKFPDSKIHVQSILPVLPKAEKNYHLSNKYIEEYNIEIMKMAKEEGISFINIASILNDSNGNLYEDDGLHLRSDFYTLWLNYLENN